VLRQQNVTTLEQALRNVPGITVSIGEGNGGVNGDQFRIRGFNAQNDVLSDGLREIGAFQRDMFNVDSVAVLQGPSGFAVGGAGSVGGAINSTTRTPHLGNSYGGVATGGMGPMMRATGDVNVQVSDTIAVRVNAMVENSTLVDRDGQDNEKYGFAPSIAFGLGTDTTASIEYMHYHYDRATDGGVPVSTPTGHAYGQPVTEFGVRRANWYGIQNDRDNVTVDRVTGRITHQANSWLTLTNDTRVAWVDRSFAFSPASASTAVIDQFLAGGNPLVSVGGGGSPYTQKTWGIQNIAQALARFTTGSLRHEAILGIDASYEDADRKGYGFVPGRGSVPQFLRDPANGYMLGVTSAATSQRETEISQVALFASERLWIVPEFSIIAGLRWTYYDLSHKNGAPGAVPTVDVSTDDNFVDPRVSLVFEPTQSQTYYATWSRSTTPPGINFTTLPAGQSNQTNAQNQANINETNTLWEAGAKISVISNRLGLAAALFRIDKDNATETDPLTGTVFTSSDKQRNQGIEIGISGTPLPNWNINLNYVYIDSETRDSANAAAKGKRVAYVPENAVSLWTTYEINPGEAWNLLVGGGITWRDKVWLNNTNTNRAPENFSLDGVVAHRINNNLTLQVNGYNLTDETNYTALFGNRAVPAPGRTVLVSLAADF
jgi:catecholate siderophore receptor